MTVRPDHYFAMRGFFISSYLRIIKISRMDLSRWNMQLGNMHLGKAWIEILTRRVASRIESVSLKPIHFAVSSDTVKIPSSNVSHSNIGGDTSEEKSATRRSRIVESKNRKWIGCNEACRRYYWPQTCDNPRTDKVLRDKSWACND